MKKFVSVLLAVFFTVNTALAAGGDSAGNEIGGLKFSPIVAGDVTDKITAVGALRTTRIPTVVPVSGQSFKRAAVIKNGKYGTMAQNSVAMRLEPTFTNGTISAGDIVVLSVYMKVANGEGYARPFVETKDNSANVIFETEPTKIDEIWKKYSYVTVAKADIPAVKININIGFSEQITYFADLKLDNYGSEYDISDVKKAVFGENYEIEEAEKAEQEKEEKKKALIGTAAFAANDPNVYTENGGERILSGSTPFSKNNKLYVPLRYVSEKFGAQVEYNAQTEGVTIIKDGDVIEVYKSSSMWKLNGRPWRAQYGIEYNGGSVFIPYDVISELLKIKCLYNSDKKICIFANTSESLDLLDKMKYTDDIYTESVLTPRGNFNLTLESEYFESEVGTPAVLDVGDEIPSFKMESSIDADVRYKILRDSTVISENNTFHINNSEEKTFEISDKILTADLGEYKIEFQILSGDKTYYDALYFCIIDKSSLKNDDAVIVHKGSDGKLVYAPDYLGNRIPDYSGAGYKNGAVKIPDVPAVIEISPSGGDDTANIQSAIDYVSHLPVRNDGTRGAVQLTKGVFKVSGMFTISSDGVVLRGSGNDNAKIANAVPTGDADEFAQKHKDTEGTIILLTTKVPETRMLDIIGTGGAVKIEASKQNIIDNYVPTGAYSFRVENASEYNEGDEIIIEQYGNLAWVHEIGMDNIPARTTQDANQKNNENSATVQWKEHTWTFERTIVKKEGNVIYIDMPVMNAIAEKWGGANIYKYTDTGRIQNVGVENMRVIAAWTPNSDNVDDTRHAGELATLKNCKDVWLRDITTEHLNLYNVNIYSTAKRVTVQDFYCLVAPPSYYMGNGYESTGRTFLETKVYVGRYGVYMGGQQVLVQRFHGTNLRHLVEYKNDVAGPNVAYDCKSVDYFSQMGPHMLWSAGGLYDNTDGALHIQNRLSMGSGHGWAGAWFTAWNTTDRLAVQKPPTAQNWAVGHIGAVSAGDYPQFEQGYWELEGTRSNIDSLFVAQTNERYGQSGLDVINAKADYDYTIHEVPTDLALDSISENSEKTDE